MGGHRFAESRSRSVEDQIWAHLDRMHDAGPVADYYLAAHERQASALRTERSATSGTSAAVAALPACWRWIGICVSAAARGLARVKPEETVAADRFVTSQRRLAR